MSVMSTYDSGGGEGGANPKVSKIKWCMVLYTFLVKLLDANIKLQRDR